MSDRKYFTEEEKKAARRAKYEQKLLEKGKQKRVAKYETEEERQKARRKSRNATRKKQQPKEKEFITWDGEGVTIEGHHRYNLLMHSKNEHITNLEGLPSEDCFNFLCDTGKEYPQHIHVIFSGSYDCNMMFKDIHKSLLKRLHETGKIYWKNFKIEYRPKKYLEIRRYKQEIFLHKTKRKPDGQIILWDTFGFFQSSFLEALKSFFSPVELQELGYEQIKAGKDRRSQFSEEELENFVIPYTKLELNALEKLMDRLYNQYCLHTKPYPITLRRFDGAGAIAHSLLTSYNVKRYYPQNEQKADMKTERGKTPVPSDVIIASQHAYGGGRIELLKYGHIDSTRFFHYDINSAYPNEYLDLLDLSHGQWIYHTDKYLSNSTISVYKVLWDYTEEPIKPFYPFFYRSFHGDITFPAYGLNWVWKPELEVALKWLKKLPGRIEILESWEYIPDNPEIRPYAFIKDMYAIRRELKEKGNGMQQVYKLGYNSFYGKTVQHLGYDDHSKRGEKNWRPPFFNLVYGGRITSGVRAKMFDAAMQHPNDIIGFATDGFWSLQPIKLQTGNELGEWEYEELSSGTFVQSGVYWCHDVNGKEEQHFRGFDKERLKEDLVLKAWKEKKEVLPIKTKRFVTLGQGLKLKDWSLWHEWPETDRELKLNPTDGHGKRDRWYSIKKNTKHVREYPVVFPEKQLVPTFPNNSKVAINEKNQIIISEPFPLPWSKEREEYNKIRSDVTLEREIEESIEEQYE